MKSFLLSILACIFFVSVQAGAPKYYLSACAIFQDEAPYLKEWVEYHRLVGIKHFYLYNNNSHDNYLKVIKPYIDSGIITLTQWPTKNQNLTDTQVDVYNHCIKKAKGKTRWLAVIDIDEFIVPVNKNSIPEVLKQFDGDHSIGGLMLFWQTYGTSYCPKIPTDKLMIECLKLKAVYNHPWNQQVKTICKPHKVDKFYVHGATYRSGFRDVTTNGRGGRHQPIQLDQIRINHYWTKDEDFFYNIKIPRKEEWMGRKFTPEEIQGFIQSFNYEEDGAIFPFVQPLRKIMFGQ